MVRLEAAALHPVQLVLTVLVVVMAAKHLLDLSLASVDLTPLQAALKVTSVLQVAEVLYLPAVLLVVWAALRVIPIT